MNLNLRLLFLSIPTCRNKIGNSCSEHLKENDYAIRHFGANTLAKLKPLGSFRKCFANQEVVHNAG